MCTIVVFHRIHRDAPLVVAANRDEFYARPATSPSPLPDEPQIIAGRDLEKGGTWLGATTSGFFVGLTNQRSYGLADPALQSRGEIALELLRGGTSEAARALLHALDPRQYNPFNLFFGTASDLFVAYGRRECPEVEIDALPTGLYVLTNDRLGSPEFPKIERAEALAKSAVDAPLGSEPLRALVADHTLPPLERIPEPPEGSLFDREMARQLQSVCIHSPLYGTCSSTLLSIGEAGLLRYLYADGPPCVTAFREVVVERS